MCAKSIRKMISMLLAVLMLAAVLPVGSLAAEDAFEMESPVVLVTGTAVIGNDGVYSKDSVGYEKAYTLKEVQDLGSGSTYYYSVLNSYGTQKYYTAVGTELSLLVADTAYDVAEDKLTVMAPDGFNSAFDPKLVENPDAPSYRVTKGLDTVRYYYPNYSKYDYDINTKTGTGGDKAIVDATEVPTIISWASAVGPVAKYNPLTGKITEELTPPAQAEEHADGGLSVLTGQRNLDEWNNPMFVDDVRYLIGGESIEETALTINTRQNGKDIGSDELTRGEILLLDRGTRTYSFESSSGTRNDVATGVPLSVLLEGVDTDAVISFATADDYDVSEFTMTLADLIEQNYMLAYELDGKAIYNTAKGDSSVYGFFTLYGDDAKPAKLVDTINIKLPVEFDDLEEGKWYYDAVDYAVDNGIFKGISDTTFEPNTNIQRGMFVTVLHRLEGEPEVTGTNKFTDVPNGRYFTDAVIWAADNGIVNGMTATTFAPSAEITREQMVTIMYRYAQKKGYDTEKTADLTGFADVDNISKFAKDAFSWAVAEGLVNGVGGNQLAPQGNATRAQVATILMRFEQTVAAQG